ncbi:MAG: hypothetical protein MI810_01615 [Flavobacteriales bacterium]|nr:hypothetical protein [Flavobacteriales bacterium]
MMTTLITITVAGRTQILGGAIHASAGPSFMNYKSFKDFSQAYQNYFVSSPSPAGDFTVGKLNYGFTRSFGVAFHAAYCWIEFGASKTKSATSFDFENGTARVFELKRRYFEGYFGFGPMDEWGSFSLGIGYSLGENSLSTGFQYLNKTVSYGEDAVLNGIYRTFSGRAYLSTRLSIALFESPIAAFCNINYTPPIFASDLEDDARGKTLNSIGIPVYNHLPTDNYTPSAGVDYGYENVVTTKWSELTIELGFAINIFER